MAMDLLEFRQDLINNIETAAVSSGTYPIEEFIEYGKDILINDFSLLSELNHTFYEYPGQPPKYKKMHLDASYLELSLNTLHLLYVDYNIGDIEDINNEFINSKVNLLVNYFINVNKGFFSNTAESDPATYLAHDIRKNIRDIKKLHLIIISTNKKSKRLNTTLSVKPITIEGSIYNVDITLLDIERIYETKLASFKKDDITIDTLEYGIEGIPCIKADIESEDYDSYLCIVPGKFLSDIYQKYSARLLECNVRSFLNTKGEINKGILNTILTEKSRFFAYNNGISTTASNIETKFIEGKGLCITSFKNLQIINGGQTTASLASAVIKQNANLDGIYVQMKLSIIKNDEAYDDLVRLISKFANKQNKVTNADLSSNHPYYAKIEEFSRKIKCNLVANSTIQSIWFFERARGQYDQSKMQLKTKKEREMFEYNNPKKQKFTKTDLAKYINSADMKPYFVSWGAEVNLIKFQINMEQEWAKNQAMFNQRYYMELIGKGIMFKEIEKIISNEEWYIENRAYRAQLVPYTFSKFIYEIEKTGKVFDFKKVWDKQTIPVEAVDDLKKIAYLCFKIFYDENRPFSNIGEYAKRDICWKNVMDVKYELSSALISILVDKDDIIAEERLAEKDQKFDNNISIEVEIFKLGINYWTILQERGKQLEILNDFEISMCDLAIKYIKRITPNLSKKQVKSIWSVKEKMEKNGINI